MFTTLFVISQLISSPLPNDLMDSNKQLSESDSKTFAVTVSWYDLSGRKMANGEIFNGQNRIFAAHKSLPFGTKIQLTNPNNQKSLTVEITDRGPFIKGRDLDVSRAAAEYLGFTKEGVEKMEAKIVLAMAF